MSQDRVFISRYPARLLDVDLMASEDIDGLYPESVRTHLSQGSFDVSSRRRGVELLPPRHSLHPHHLLLCSPPVSLHRAVLINVSAVRKGGNERGGKTSQYKVAFKISATLKAIPPWRQQGWAVLYQRCQLSAWHKPLDSWWGYFPKDLFDSVCFCLNIYRQAGTKLWIFGSQIHEKAVLLLLLMLLFGFWGHISFLKNVYRKNDDDYFLVVHSLFLFEIFNCQGN